MVRCGSLNRAELVTRSRLVTEFFPCHRFLCTSCQWLVGYFAVGRLFAEAPRGTPSQNRTFYSIYISTYLYLCCDACMYKSIFNTAVCLNKNLMKIHILWIIEIGQKPRGKIETNEQYREIFA